MPPPPAGPPPAGTEYPNGATALPPPGSGNPNGQYPGAPAYFPPSYPPPALGAREHNGFYLRLGLGGGRLGVNFGSNRSHDLGGSVEGGFGEGSVAFELALGGTPAPGLVIGGGLYVDFTPGQPETSTLKVNGKSASPLVFDRASIALLGPFADYYFDPKLGWHAQGALGIASMGLGKGSQADKPATGSKGMGGLGFMIGGGYEWWIAEQWSMGVLLRFTYVAVESDHGDAEVWMAKGFAIPEIMFGTTYH